ncbi:fructose-bisphosphatase class II [Klebsiella pneumoniae subsp. pneumoniae]|nr:fructose-bisphosphatase class II [Klebsiella pneumoniae subsp. pneumoniae]
MARSDNVVFSATGITKGDLLDGITRKGNMATTETLLIRGKSRTIRRIQSIHYLDRKRSGHSAAHPCNTAFFLPGNRPQAVALFFVYI